MCAGTRGDVQPFIALGLQLQVAALHKTVHLCNLLHTLRTPAQPLSSFVCPSVQHLSSGLIEVCFMHGPVVSHNSNWWTLCLREGLAFNFNALMHRTLALAQMPTLVQLGKCGGPLSSYP